MFSNVFFSSSFSSSLSRLPHTVHNILLVFVSNWLAGYLKNETHLWLYVFINVHVQCVFSFILFSAVEFSVFSNFARSPLQSTTLYCTYIKKKNLYSYSTCIYGISFVVFHVNLYEFIAHLFIASCVRVSGPRDTQKYTYQNPNSADSRRLKRKELLVCCCFVEKILYGFRFGVFVWFGLDRIGSVRWYEHFFSFFFSFLSFIFLQTSADSNSERVRCAVWYTNIPLCNI